LVYRRQTVILVELQIQTYSEKLIVSENFDDLLLRRTYNLIGIIVEARIIAKKWIKLTQNLQKERYDKKIIHRSFQQNNLVLEFRLKN
jgi:hypothetical protein